VNSEREEHKKVKKPYCASLTKRPRSALHPAYTVRLLRAEGKDSIPLSTGRRTPASPALPSAISKLPPILANASCSHIHQPYQSVPQPSPSRKNDHFCCYGDFPTLRHASTYLSASNN